MLKHLTDKEWLKKRELLWEHRKRDYWEESSEVQEAQRAFFFNGDFDSLVRVKPILFFSDVLEGFPAETLDEVKFITKKYWEHALTTNNSWYSKETGKTNDEKFLSAFESSYSEVLYHSAELMADMFHWIYGEQYERKRSIDIGLDMWEPQADIEPLRMANRVYSGMSSYLFSKADYTQYRYILDYFISVIDKFEENYLDTQLAKKSVKNKSGGRLFAGQKKMRKFFLQLNNYNLEKTVRNDLIAEQRIRDAIDSIQMPDEFYPFIEFIHKYKQSAVTASDGDPLPSQAIEPSDNHIEPFQKDEDSGAIPEDEVDSDETELQAAFEAFARKYQLKLTDDWFLTPGYYFEMDGQLVSILSENGTVQDSETGLAPCHHIPETIAEYLSDTAWRIDSVSSSDNWEMARVVLKKDDGTLYEFDIDDVENSDRVPINLFTKMRQFTQDHCAQTVISLSDEDGMFLLLPLPHEAAKELNQLIEAHCIPYDF